MCIFKFIYGVFYGLVMMVDSVGWMLGCVCDVEWNYEVNVYGCGV